MQVTATGVLEGGSRDLEYPPGHSPQSDRSR